MRGKVQTAFTFLIDTGITPAYAGKSILIGYGKFFLWDHPRLCGEKQNGFPLAVGGVGSPPPMRGKEWTFQRSHGRCRITPAYAGKSNSSDTLSNMN